MINLSAGNVSSAFLIRWAMISAGFDLLGLDVHHAKPERTVPT